MLAGPRKKQKVINVLSPTNTTWSNDSQKIGQKMLEKMGWTPGKGLGANLNGMSEHIKSKYKNDNSGLGFVDKDDQWTKHDDDFNSLLQKLSNSDDSSNALHSGVSLEKKSKSSKARVHYHKFLRGKDIAQYSEKDLANIFGKKSLKKEKKRALEIEDKKFVTGGNMADYFKSKIAKLNSNSDSNSQGNGCSDGETLNHGFKGFSDGVTSSNELTGFRGFNTIEEFCESSPKSDSGSDRNDGDNGTVNAEKSDNSNDFCGFTTITDYCETTKRKTKKNKRKDVAEASQVEVEPADESISENNVTTKSKKKKKKGKDLEVEMPDDVATKSKKKKRKDKDLECNAQVVETDEVPSSKKEYMETVIAAEDAGSCVSLQENYSREKSVKNKKKDKK